MAAAGAVICPRSFIQSVVSRSKKMHIIQEEAREDDEEDEEGSKTASSDDDSNEGSDEDDVEHLLAPLIRSTDRNTIL